VDKITKDTEITIQDNAPVLRHGEPIGKVTDVVQTEGGVFANLRTDKETYVAALAKFSPEEKIVERLSVTIEPHRHFPNNREIRSLRITTIVNGEEHFIEDAVSVDDLVSYFDAYWEYLGRNVKEHLKE
jgi:hypothetical protein